MEQLKRSVDAVVESAIETPGGNRILVKNIIAQQITRKRGIYCICRRKLIMQHFNDNAYAICNETYDNCANPTTCVQLCGKNAHINTYYYHKTTGTHIQGVKVQA